jgi:taurine dioxygenase
MSHPPFGLRRLPVGAEVTGLGAGDEANLATRAGLFDAWVEHGLLLFRRVETAAHHLSLSRCFGELELHPFPEVRSQATELLIELGREGRPPAYVYDGVDLKVNWLAWHRDTAYLPDVARGAMLRMVQVPRREGETMFADTAAAYDDLPPDVKDRLEGLEYQATLRLGPIDQTRPGAFWKTARRATPEEDPTVREHSTHDREAAARFPPVIQPAVLVHPESGRRSIFLSPTYVDGFLGLEPSESDELLDYLVGHMLKGRFVYSHRWAPNDALVWDNLRLMHAGAGNDLDEPRFGLRTTLAGPIRTGRFVDERARTEDLPMGAD